MARVFGEVPPLVVPPTRLYLPTWPGDNLLLPPALPTSSTMVPSVIAWEYGEFYDRRCWSRPVTAIRQSSDSFRG